MDRIEGFETKCKRSYPQAGDPTLRGEREDMTAMARSKSMSVKTVLAGALVVLMVASMGVVLFSFAGAAVLFLPLLGGAFAK